MMAKDYSGRAATASPAVALFDAFIRAVPRSAGERSFSSALHQLMRLLIEVGTDFHIDDGSILCQSRYRRVSSAGVFGAMDQSFYFRAVSANSSFAECYERFRRAAPWLSWSVYENEEGWRRGPATPKSSEPMPSRVGAGTCIEALHEADSSDGRLEIGAAGAPLWRVTSMQDDRIILGRYVSAGRGAVGSPKQLMKLSRGEWAIWQRALAVKLRQVPATEIELPPAERGCKQFPASAQWSDGLVFLSAAIDAVPVEADEATVAAALAVSMGLAMDMRLAFRGATSKCSRARDSR